jgi:hypothetical protein
VTTSAPSASAADPAGSGAPLPALINPFVGPRPYTRDDHQAGHEFHGRDWEASELLDLLLAKRIVLLYSPSGAGKTSLIQAKLSPDLEQRGFEILPVVRVGLEPSTLPGYGADLRDRNRYLLCAKCSLEGRSEAGQARPLAELEALTLDEYLTRRPGTGPGDAPQLLIFDQFEEVLTRDPTDRAAKEAFFKELGAALRDRGRWALFAMR